MSSSDLTLIFDGICLLIFILNIYLGYKNGFFKTVIKLVSGIIAFFVAMNFGPVFAKAIDLTVFLPTEYQLFAPFINRLIWYLTTFLAVLILLKLIALVTEIINKAPIIGTFNKLFGALVSFIYSFIIVGIISIIISLPIFSFKEAYEASILKPINKITVICLNSITDVELEFDTYADTYKEKLYDWLTNNDLLNLEFYSESSDNKTSDEGANE